MVTNAADFGRGRTQVEINAAITTAYNAGGGTVFVPRTGGPWSLNRSDPADQKSGAIVMRPGVRLDSDGATLNVVGNTQFIRAASTLGARVAIAADVAANDSTLTIADSSGFAVGDDVFLRLGQASYDAGEPDFWLYAKVAAVPTPTTLTLNQPVGRAVTVAAVTNSAQRSVAKVTALVDDVEITGSWVLNNPMTDQANAECGIWLQYAPTARIGNITATNPGAGAILAQFVDNLTIGHVKVPHSVAQNGHSAKGRALNFAEVRCARIASLEVADFERAAVVVEGRCEAVAIDKVRLVNSNAARVNATTPLVSLLGNSKLRIDDLWLSGNCSYVLDEGGTSGNSARIGNFYSYTAGRLTFSSLGIVTGDLHVDGALYTCRQRERVTIPLVPNMNTVDVPLPAGLLYRTRVYASATTGLTKFQVGSGALRSNNLAAVLLAGGSVDVGGQGRGFGPGYSSSSDDTKRVTVSTDGTVPAGAYLVVDVDLFTK